MALRSDGEPVRPPLPDWHGLSFAEKRARHLHAADVAECEAAACIDLRARRHALNNAMQHRYAIEELEERHGPRTLWPAWRV